MEKIQTYTHFFEKIDTEAKAYWLGFLYADGCNLPDYNRTVLMLSIKDRGHLVKFCDFLGLNRDKVKIEEHKSKVCMGREFKKSISAKVIMYSKYVSKCLKNLGMLKNKSLILSFPDENIVDKFFIRHFIRGYFDGDG